MKLGGIAKIAGVVSSVAKADNPAEKAGAIAAGAAIAAHPIAGTLAAPLIKKGVSKVVQKGIDTAKDPEVQDRVKSAGSRAATRGRTAMSGLTSRVGELRAGLGN
jgi:hypothetical protein